jgi:hypothetical protein
MRTIRVITEEYILPQSNVLLWTRNNGVLPINSNTDRLEVYQNGQLLMPSQYTVGSSQITIDPAIHYFRSNYTIKAVISV